MTSSVLNVLVVEDNPDDVLLLRVSLNADRLDTFALTGAERLSRALELLSQRHFDIALLDLGLPDSQGLQTFIQLHRQFPDLPVVVCSGNSDEQAAIEAVRAGAQDYLVKGQTAFELAARTIRYAIERQKLAKSLQESEEKYRRLFTEMMDGFALHEMLTDSLGKLVDYVTVEVNPAFESLLGKPREMVVGRKASEILPREELEHWLGIFGSVALTGKSVHYQMYSPLNQKYFEGTAYSPEHGKFAVTFSDITERKQAEEKLRESEARQRTIVHTSPLPIVISRVKDGKYIEANGAFEKLSGYSIGELIGHTAGELNIWTDLNRRARMLEELRTKGTVRDFEFQIQNKAGERYDLLMSAELIELGGEACVLTLGLDITERKRAETNLTQRLAELELLYQSGLALSSELEPKQIAGKLIEALKNKMDWHHVAIRRYDPASDRLELLAFSQPGLINELQRQTVEARFNELISNSSQGLSGWVVRHAQMVRSGNVHLDERYVDTHPGVCSGLYAPMLLGERVVGVVSVESEALEAFSESDERLLKTIANQAAVAFENARLFQNLQRELAERQRIEAGLRESEERYRTVAYFTHDWEYWVDPQRQFIYLSPSCERITGYPPEAFRADPQLIEKIIYPADQSVLRDHMHLEFSHGKPANIDFRILTADGEIRWINHVCQSVHGTDGSWLGRRASNRDITERKKAEQRVQDLQQFSSATLDALSAHLCVLDENGVIISVNQAWRKFAESNSSTPAEHYLGANYLTVCDNARGKDSEEAAAVAQGIRAVMDGSLEAFQMEYPCHSPQERRWFTIKVTRFTQNGAVRIAIAHESITERIQAEAKLRESEARFKSIFNTSPVRVSITRFEDAKFLDVNDGFLVSTGYTRDEVIGHTSVELNDWVDPEERLRLHRLVAETPPVWNYEARLRQKSGEIRNVLISADLIEIFGERCILSVGLDLTERKRVDTEREASLEIMQGLAFSQSIDEFLALVHYSLGRLLKTENIFIALYDARRAEFNYVYWVDQDARPDHSSLHDKTLTSYIFNNRAPFLYTPERFEKLVADGEVERAGADSPSFIGVPLIAYGEVIGVMAVQDYEQAGLYSEHDLRLMTSIGGYVALAVQRKREEEALQQSEQRFAALFRSNPAAIAITRLSTNRLVDVNQAWETLTGYSQAEVVGQTPAEFNFWVDPGQRVRLIDEVREHLSTHVDVQLRRKSGEIRHLLMSAEKVNLAGEDYLLTMAEDITERKLVEDALRESQGRYLSLFENSPVSIWEEDFSQAKLYFDELRASGVEDFAAYFAAHLEAVQECSVRVKVLDVNRATLDLMETDDKDTIINILTSTLNSHDLETFIRELSSLANGDLHFIGEETIHTFTGIRKDVILHVSVAPGYETTLGKVIVSILDITERKQAENALRASEGRYRLLINQLPALVYIDDPFGETQYISPQIETILGYTPLEWLNGGLALWKASIHPAEREKVFAEYMRCIQKRQPFFCEYRLRKQDESYLWVQDQFTILPDGRTDSFLVHGLIYDVTERKQTEQELREANGRFTQLINNINDIFWVSDPVTRQNVYVSPAFESIVGLSMDGVLQLPNKFLDVVLPEDRPIVLEAREQEDHGLRTDIQYRIQRPDGSLRWVRDKGSPVFDEQGSVIRVVGITTDITELRQAEAALRESEANYRLLFELSPDGIVTHDGRQIVFANLAAAKMIGAKTREALVGKNIIDFVHPDSRPQMLKRIKKEAKGEFVPPAEEKFIRLDGEIIYVEVSAAPVTRHSQSIFLVTIHDITDRKRVEFEITYRQQLLEKVIQLGKNITAITDLDDCLRQIHHCVKQGLGFDRVGIFLYEAGSNLIQGTYGTSRTGELESNRWYRRPVEAWTDWQVALQSPNGMAVDRDFQLVHNPGSDDEMYGVKEHVTLAAWAGEAPVALLAVDNFVSHRGIVTADLEALQLFAGYVGLAIANAQLHAGLEQRIKERTAEVQDLYDNAPTGYHSMDANGKIVMMNQTELMWLGYTRDEVIGRSIDDFMLPLSASASLSFPKLQKEGWVRDVEFDMLRKDGSSFPVLLNASAVYDADGNFIMSRATIFDNTERKKASEALRASEARLNFLLSKTPAMIFTSRLDENLSVSFISESVRDILGYEPSQYTENPKFWQSITHPDDWTDSMMSAIQELRQTGHAIWESRLQRADGAYCWISTGASLLRDEQGQPLEVIGYSVNIDEQKKAQQALRDSEETYRALFESSADAIFLTEVRDGSFVSVNPRGPELLGFDRAEELVGRKLVEFIEASQNADPEDQAERLLKGERIQPSGQIMIRKDGSKVETELNLSLIRDSQGQPRYLQSVVRDITLRKQAEQAIRESEAQLRISRDQLSAANAALEQAARLKDEFLASMSHELRTPLTGILGLSEALQMKTYGELTEKQAKALKNIESSGRHLLELINDILDLSKIEAGKFEMQFEPCSVGDICQSSLQLTRGLAQKKSQNVSFSMNPATLIVRADARRLKQMLVNLLSNAIKFTPEGGSLGLEVRANEDERHVTLTVWDKGVGIATEDMKKLFKPFVQLDSSLARQHSGTGLGLSLVQRMAELHGGSIKVESMPGEGSQFTIVLPWSPQGTRPIPHLSAGTGSLYQTMMVDDSEIDAEQITRYLMHLGIENLVHPIGDGAVEVAAHHQPGVILLDLHLPDFSGFEVLENLKADPRTEKIPVVICSVEESRSRAMVRGAAGYLVKPFTLTELRIELARVVAEQKRQESVMMIAPQRLVPHILIADDNEVTLETLSDFLSAQHFHVTLVRSGIELLDLAPEIHPDLILMDIQMPGMDGLETTRRVRAHTDPRLARVPIIALTALALVGDREMCLKAGANDYLSKPIQLQTLVATIRKLLERS